MEIESVESIKDVLFSGESGDCGAVEKNMSTTDPDLRAFCFTVSLLLLRPISKYPNDCLAAFHACA